ncbi:hypothetical protein GCM10009807_12100 [Microbacterium lacus]|uniref:DUF916 domain-containing protein n=1 Tax=Microbacterium lacus TaxID=415217 RepID=A0ABP4S9N9_9MICO
MGISAQPADAAGRPDGRTSFRYQIDPGQRVDDYFLVSNTGTADQAFTVVATDAFNDGEGDYALLATGESPEQIGTWVTFENGANRIEFTLGPGQSRVLPFTMQVPADATPGDHVGGVLASVITPGEEVNLDRRVASRLYARVAGDLQPRLAISGIDGSYNGDWWNLLSGTTTVHYTVSNPGNVALSANASGEVRTWFGIPVDSASGGSIAELLPGNSATYEIAVSGVAQLGYLNAEVVLHPFVDSPDAAAQLPVSPVSRDTPLVAVPWLLLIVFLLLGAVFGFRAWRRRADQKRAEAWMEYTEAEAKRKAEADLVGAGTRSSE